MPELDRKLYDLLLALYPADFRDAHRRELEENYAWCMQVERERRGFLPARLRGLIDAVRGAVALRRRVIAEPRRSRMGTFGQDLQFTFRAWRRAPLFAAGAILVLALGVGANGAIFSLVRAVLLEPLPYNTPDRVVMVWQGQQISGLRRVGTTTPVKRWRDGHKGVLQDLAALKMWSGNPEAWFDLVLTDRAERLRAGLVTPNFFELLGTPAMLGRAFTTADETAGRTDLVVLSHGLWQRAFGGDEGVIGRAVTFVSGRGPERVPRPYTVVGVLPPSFRFTYPIDTELWAIYPWTAINADPGATIGISAVVARLAAGVTFDTANATLATVPPETVGPNTPDADRPVTRLERIADWVVSDMRPTMLLLSGVALLLLVIACATVANGLLVRLAERQRELALRASLGASRGRLIRQLLTEGLALSLAGTAVGSFFAVVLLPVFRSIVPPLVPRADEMVVDLWMLAFAAGTAMIVTALAATLPALQASRFDVVTALKRASAGASASRRATRWRLGLVGAQAAIATCLLVGATLLLLSFWRLGRVELGYDGNDVLTVEMRLIEPKYRQPGVLGAFQDTLMTRVRALPGVVEAGMTTAVPFRGVDFTNTYDAPGCETPPGVQPPPECAGRHIAAGRRVVDPAFFSIMRMGAREGRLIQESDAPTSQQVAVVSASFARNMFPSQSPIGQRLNTGRGFVEIVGVVNDVRYVSRDKEARPAIYFARAQSPAELICLVVRTTPGASGMGTALQRAIHEIDPTIPAMNITTIDRIISDSVADRRFYTTATTAFAGLALLLTAIGLVVVIGRSVVERRREVAIRTALGARAGQLMGLIARQGLAPIVAGVAAGLVAAWFSATILQQFLFQMTVHEPWVYVVAGLVTACVGTIACLLPARRLTVDTPATLLRGE